MAEKLVKHVHRCQFFCTIKTSASEDSPSVMALQPSLRDDSDQRGQPNRVGIDMMVRAIVFVLPLEIPS